MTTNISLSIFVLFTKIDAHDNTWNHIIFVERRVEIEVSNDFIGLSYVFKFIMKINETTVISILDCDCKKKIILL